MPATPSTLKRRRNRKSKPALQRIRAWTWYAAVKARAAQRKDLNSDSNLDRFFVLETPDGGRPPVKRPRAFCRIRHVGTDPEHFNIRGIDYDLVNWVETKRDENGQHVGLVGTSSVFNSSFWDLLTNPYRDLQQLRSQLTGYAARLGLYRADLWMITRADLLKARSAAFQPINVTTYNNLLVALSNLPTIDCLAFLSALYLEAALTGLHEQAVRVRDELAIALSNFYATNSVPLSLAKAITDLVSIRIILNRWDNHQKLCLVKGWSPYKFEENPDSNEWFAGLVGLPNVQEDIVGLYPWVPFTPQLEAFIKRTKSRPLRWHDKAQKELNQKIFRDNVRAMLGEAIDADLGDKRLPTFEYSPLFYSYPWRNIKSK